PPTPPCLGAAVPWWGALAPGLHDPLWPGWVAPLLAIAGLVAHRQRAGAWGWALGAAAALLLALGPVLKINGVLTGLPLPWALLQTLPIFNAVGKVERFVVLARLCLIPLVAWGT